MLSSPNHSFMQQVGFMLHWEKMGGGGGESISTIALEIEESRTKIGEEGEGQAKRKLT